MAALGFVVSKLVSGLAEPTSLLLLSGVVGVGLLFAGRRRAGGAGADRAGGAGANRQGRAGLRRAGLALLVLPLVFELVLDVVPLSDWAVAPLEDRFPTLRTIPPDITGVITIGGAVDPEMTAYRGIPSLNEAAERMTEFVRLALLHPAWRLAFSGGSGRVLRADMSEADVARMLWDGLGLAGRPIIYEDRSRTTWENAVLLARIVHPAPGERWILITSAMHMPRAMGVFRRAGWDVVADPVAYKTAPVADVEAEQSLAGRLALLDAAVHEWAGLVIYRVEGKTARLFPGP